VAGFQPGEVKGPRLSRFCPELEAGGSVVRPPVRDSGLTPGACPEQLQIKRYLTRHAGLKLPSNWEQMQSLSGIRNCIAHAGGRVEECDNKDKLQNLKIPGFSINQDEFTGDNLIELTEDFCRWALEGVEKLLGELCDAAGFPPPRIKIEHDRD